MKKSKLFTLAGVTLLSVAVLAACSNGSSNNNSGSKSSSSESNEPKTYSYVYSTDPTTLDYLLDNHTSTSDHVTNFVDGLLENDKYGNLVPSLAEDWTVSEDGLTYTYTLRDGLKWVEADGTEYADVTAQDFVTGLKHAADKESLALYIVKDSVKGLKEYIEGTEKDFSKVGIKAVDDKTIQYTLTKPEPFWNSKTTMGILFPVNEEFLTSKGDKFGDATDPNSILYNGAYTLSALTSKSSIEMVKNESYWDVDNVKVDEVKLTYFDGKNPEILVEEFEKGNYTTARVFPTSSTYSDVKEKYGDNIYYTPQQASTFYAMFNLDRQVYNMTSKTDDKTKADTKAALLNKDFRQALAFAFDRQTYNSHRVGEDGAKYALRTLLVPSDFVSVGETSWDDIVEKHVVTYGDEWKDIDFADGQDQVFNKEKAQAEFKKAKDALAKEGVTFPVQLDVPVIESNEQSVSTSQSFKQFIEDALGKENVVVNLQMKSEEEVYAGTYYAENASQADYDVNLSSGWGPDFQDPSTYLDIMNPANEGTMTYTIGIDGGTNSEVAKKLGFDEYDKLLDEASAETSDVAKRYDTYAKAQAWLLDSAVIVPYISNGGAPGVSKVVPFTAARSSVGIKGAGFTYKTLEIQDEVVTTEQYEKAKADYLKEKAKSNAKAEKDLEKHIEK